MAKKNTPHAYAQALVELAAEPWLKGLRLINRRLHEQDLIARLDDPTLSVSDKATLLIPITGDVIPQVTAFVRTLAAGGDINTLDAIVNEFETLIVRRSRYVLAHVRSAVPLTNEERKQLEENLARRFGGNLETQYEVDAALLGGVVVRVGDEVIDGSLAGKLEALRQQLS